MIWSFVTWQAVCKRDRVCYEILISILHVQLLCELSCLFPWMDNYWILLDNKHQYNIQIIPFPSLFFFQLLSTMNCVLWHPITFFAAAVDRKSQKSVIFHDFAVRRLFRSSKSFKQTIVCNSHQCLLPNNVLIETHYTLASK